MLNKDICVHAVKTFRARHDLDASDENVIATIHLMNTHGVDVHAALDQSSRSANDHGIDAWYFHEANRELFVYQSKLTESKSLALRGISDLDRARLWLEQIIIEENHDKIFDRSIPKYPRDIVFVSNLLKAMKRGLNSYLELPTHANSNAPVIFRKPIVRTHVYNLVLLHFYQNDNRWSARDDFSVSLSKKASPKLVDEIQIFYQKIVTKIKNWYTDDSKDLTVEISKRKMDGFFGGLATELGVDAVEGVMPFSVTSIDWAKYRGE